MGLLDHIESGLDINKGSLSPADVGELSFFDFVTKNSIPHCAIFTPCENNFIISNSIGFDADSIISSFSTIDFWDGTTKKDEWTFFSRNDNTIHPLLQFFSKSLKDKINFAGTFYSDDSILLVAFESEQDTTKFAKIKSDFDKIDFTLPNKILGHAEPATTKFKLSLDYKDAMLDFSSKSNSLINSISAAPKINSAIRSEIEYKLYLLSNEFVNFTKAETFKISCNACSANNISEASLKSFINLNLKPILNSSVNLISYHAN